MWLNVDDKMNKQLWHVNNTTWRLKKCGFIIPYVVVG